MLNIRGLSNEEFKTLCNLITGKKIKNCFRKNPAFFGSIKPGFRPTSISDQDAVLIAIKNREDPVIVDFVDSVTKEYISILDDNVRKMVAKVINSDYALATILSESKFCDHIELYFKLKSDIIDQELLSRIQSIVISKNDVGKTADINDDDTIDVPIDNKDTDMGTIEKISELEKEIEVLLQEKSENDSRWAVEGKKLQDKIDLLTQQEDESAQQIIRLKQQIKEYETLLQEIKERKEYESKVNVESVLSSNYEHVSLCEVTEPDYQGIKYLYRLADIDRQGRIEQYYPDPNKPLDFDNRNRLFYKDGKSDPGTVAVWEWSAVPKANDPSKDYLKRNFNRFLAPVEVILYRECSSIEELLKLLKRGVREKIQTERVLFAVNLSKGSLSGLLCLRSELDQSEDYCRLSDHIFNLPRYDFAFGDTVRLDNDRYYFRKINLGVPDEIVRAKNSIDLIKTLLLSRSTWSSFKELGKARSEWKNVRGFLDSIDDNTLIDDIKNQARCTTEEAHAVFDEFMAYLNTYINGTTIEDKIVEAVIVANEDLKERCKSLLSEEWKEEHQVVLAEAEENLRKLKEEISLCQGEYNRELAEGKRKVDEQISASQSKIAKLKSQQEYLQAENEKLTSAIESKEKLAADVEELVAERIKDARENVADFIADMAFICPPFDTSSSAEKTIEISKKESSKEQTATEEPTEEIVVQLPNQEKITYYHGRKLDPDGLEVNNDWKDAIEHITDELLEAGVASNYRWPLAGYLYSAFVLHIPLFLIGPNASEIADAFSAGLFGKTAGTIECSETYSSGTVEECFNKDDPVVKILYPFNGTWINRIPDIIRNREKYFFIVHPFNEDIQIEPGSLYSYMLPVLTSLFVDNEPTGQMLGAVLDNEFVEYSVKNPEKIHTKVLTSLKAPMLVKRRMQCLLSNMHAMIDDKSMDYDVLFGILPYAYATMHMQPLMDVLLNPDSNLKITKDLLNTITGLFGEAE